MLWMKTKQVSSMSRLIVSTAWSSLMSGRRDKAAWVRRTSSSGPSDNKHNDREGNDNVDNLTHEQIILRVVLRIGVSNAILGLVPYLSFRENMASSNMKRPLSSSSPSSGSPRPKNPRLDNLSLTHADHEKLDEEVVKRVKRAQPLYAPGTLTALILSKIVVTANGLLNNKYADPELASDLLAKDNELLTAVTAAWESKRFSLVWRMC